MTITSFAVSFAVGLLTGGTLGMLLMGLLASASHADDLAELKARAEFCEENHHPSQFPPTSYFPVDTARSEDSPPPRRDPRDQVTW